MPPRVDSLRLLPQGEEVARAPLDHLAKPFLLNLELVLLLLGQKQGKVPLDSGDGLLVGVGAQGLSQGLVQRLLVKAEGFSAKEKDGDRGHIGRLA